MEIALRKAPTDGTKRLALIEEPNGGVAPIPCPFII